MQGKYRGKKTGENEWIFGDLLHGADGKTYIVTLCDNTGTWKNNPRLLYAEVIPETVGQYTGLKDKTGKMIYEGDVVVFEDMTSTESGYWERGCIGIVVWGEETAAFEVTNRLSAESYEVLSDCEVIGNIYENPELLEGNV